MCFRRQEASWQLALHLGVIIQSLQNNENHIHGLEIEQCNPVEG
jgi:hypothetical protein